MKLLRILADPAHVAKLQRFCGIELEKPVTCDQQTQTRKNPLESDDSDSVGETEEHSLKTFPHQEENQNTIANGELFTANNEISNCHDCQKSKNGTIQSLHHDSVSIKGQGESTETTRQRLKRMQNGDSINKLGNEKLNGMVNHSSTNSSSYIITSSNTIRSKEGIVKCDAHNNEESVKERDITAVTTANPPVQIKYKSLLYLARFGAFLGNEEFYLTVFPFAIWNMDSLMVRQVAMLWCMGMYIGQAIKDYLRWPRPPSPPVARLEAHYMHEYSMPSTHAMAGTTIPFFLAYLMVERYQAPVIAMVALAVLWYCIMCWSRLFLGVHTILDIAAGTLLAVVIVFTFIEYVDGYDLYQQTHRFAGLFTLFTALALCTVLYPSDHKNSSKGDAVQIVASVAGSSIGNWLGYQLGYFHEPEILKPYILTLPTLNFCGLAVLRFLTGLGFVAIVYFVTRLSTIRFYSHMYGLDKPDKTSPGVMTAYKFTTYTITGIAISFVVPLIHVYLGIQRSGLFYEVL